MAPARYVKQTWTDGSGGGTPLSAARLGAIETGIFDASSVQMLADQTLGSSAATVDFSSIPSTFAHLQVIVYARSDLAAVSNSQFLRFNNDSAANYDSQRIQAGATSVTASEGIASTSARIPDCCGASAPANIFSMVSILVPHYAGTTGQKTGRADGDLKTTNVAGGLFSISDCFFWRSTAAINRVTLLLGSSTYTTGTRVMLLGLG